eukprot:g20473.t1
MLGKQAPASSSTPQAPGSQTPEQLIANAVNQALTGERRPLPSWNGSPSTLRSWLKLLALWEYEPNVPMEKRGIKLLQSFPEGSQPRRIADTIPTEVLLSPGGYAAILGALHQKYAPFLEASAPQAIDKFLFEGERQRGESFTAFIAAMQLSRQEMELQMGEVVNDKLCGRILLKHANLNDLQREMLLLRGPMLRPFDEIANLLRPLDRPEMLARAQESGSSSSRNYMIASKYYQQGEDPDDNLTEAEGQEDDGGEDWPSGEESQSCDEDGNVLFYLEDREYDETEAIELKAYHLAYRDARKELQERKNERGYVRHERKKVLDKPQMAEARWKRLVLAVMLIFKNMRNELVMEYLTQRQEIDLPDFEDDRKKHVKSQSADPTQWKVRMGIGKPLSRSVAQKSWQRDPDSCPHPEDQLRHRAGRGHFWYTCLGCGSRWERLQLPEDPAASSSSSTQIVKTPPRKSTQGYPKKLPAPRYRPDLGNYHINVKTQEEKGSPAMLTQGPIPPLPRSIGVVGCSGGGTLTAYLGAVDARVTAAAVACYFSTLGRELVEGTCNYDAEQIIWGMAKYGIDKPDMLRARAPQATAVLLTSHDCFPIAGGREGFAEVEAAFHAHGDATNLYASEAPGFHEALPAAPLNICAWPCSSWLNSARSQFAQRRSSRCQMWRRLALGALCLGVKALSPCDDEAGQVCPMSIGKEIGECLQDPSKHQLTDIDGNPRELEPGEKPLELSAGCKEMQRGRRKGPKLLCGLCMTDF